MSNAFVQVLPDSNGKRIDNSLLIIDDTPVYRQRVEIYAGETLPVAGPLTDVQLRATAVPVSGPLTDAQLRASPVNTTINKAFGDLIVDAWGIPKVSLPHSLFHGLFTFDIPAAQWFMYHGVTQVYTSTNIASTNSAGVVTANATQPSVTLQSRMCPRYQPNRGHLYSTALWCPSKTADGVREWGLSTTENGVFFRLKSDGLLYAVLRSNSIETVEEVIDTSVVDGFDVQKGNVYDIQYQWRGVGDYKFYINLVLVHTFENLGTLTALSMQNPALPATYKAVRTTADVAMHIGCVDISSENGSDNKLQPRTAYANISRNGTDLPVITIHNPLLINGQTNTRTIFPVHISVSCDKKAVFKTWKHRDAGLLTGETFVALGSGSFVQTDSPDTVAGAVAATAATVTTMDLLDVMNVQPNGSDEWTKHDDRVDLYLVRGDYLTLTVTTITGLCDVVIDWGEAV
jgi:hypothetical protein